MLKRVLASYTVELLAVTKVLPNAFTYLNIKKIELIFAVNLNILWKMVNGKIDFGIKRHMISYLTLNIHGILNMFSNVDIVLEMVKRQ